MVLSRGARTQTQDPREHTGAGRGTQQRDQYDFSHNSTQANMFNRAARYCDTNTGRDASEQDKTRQVKTRRCIKKKVNGENKGLYVQAARTGGMGQYSSHVSFRHLPNIISLPPTSNFPSDNST